MPSEVFRNVFLFRCFMFLIFPYLLLLLLRIESVLSPVIYKKPIDLSLLILCPIIYY